MKKYAEYPQPGEKFHGLALELPLPFLVAGEDRARASAERAVIEEDNVRIEQKLVTPFTRHLRER